MTLLFDPLPTLDVVVRREKKRKTATGQIKGRAVVVTVPAHWPKAYATEVQTRLVAQLQGQFTQDFRQVQAAQGPWITLPDAESLRAWVESLNQETFNLPLGAVRLGKAKYSRLAQMNTRTRVMTVSQHCTHNVPHDALRYLVLHELAHLHVPNHSRAFWAQVAQFDPHYKHHRQLIQAVHRVRVYEAELLRPVKQAPPVIHRPEKPSLWQQLVLPFLS